MTAASACRMPSWIKRGYGVHILLAAVFALSFSLRLAYILELQKTPLFGYFAADSSYYDEFARQILKGNFLFKDALYLHQFYPFFLAGIYFIFGYLLKAVVVVQAFIDSLSVLLLYYVCLKSLGSRRVAMASALVYSLYGISILYTGFLLETTLAVFLGLLAAALAIAAAEKGKRYLWFACGLVFAMDFLTRSNTLILLPFLLFWAGIILSKRSPGLRQCLWRCLFRG